jgi:glycosyltransferase involved in cell wall biosynthesis
MRVLFVVPSLKKSGPNNQLKNLIDSLLLLKVEISIFSINKSLESEIKLNKKKVTIFKTDFFNGFLSLRRQRKELAKIIFKLEPSVIVGSGLRPDLLLSSYKKITREKMITIIHNRMYEDYRNRYGSIVGTIVSKVHGLILRRMARVVAVSKSVAEVARGEYKLKNVDIVFNGVAVYDGKYKSQVIISDRTRPYTWIYIGHLSKLKNVELILKSFKKYKNVVKNSKLIILGSGDLEEELSKKYIDSKIEFKGYISNVDEFIESSDFYISASLTEGMPMALLEGLSGGCFPVLSAIPSHMEVLTVLGIEEFSFNPNSEVECLKVMINATKFIHRYDFDSMRHVMLTQFSNQKMAEQYLKVFNNVVKN